MTRSKAWDWTKGRAPEWLQPCQEAYYLAERWGESDHKQLLDYGCGLGRHTLFFAQRGFCVSAFDLSCEAVDSVRKSLEESKLDALVQQADMLSLPYADDSFDVVIAYNVLSHTDTAGAVQAIAEILRVLRSGGEIFLTLCSKETWSYKEAGFPRLDANTVVRMDDGPEHGIPHFFVNDKDIRELFASFDLLSVRHTNELVSLADGRPKGIHYFILARKK